MVLPERLVVAKWFCVESGLSVQGSLSIVSHEVWQVLHLDVQIDYSVAKPGDLPQRRLKRLNPRLPVGKLAEILHRLAVVHYLVRQGASSCVYFHVDGGQLDLESFYMAMDFDDGRVD